MEQINKGGTYEKINNYLRIGLILNSVFLFTNRLDVIPEFFKGLCAGLGIVLIFLGDLSEKYDLSKLRNNKKTLINRILLNK